VPAAARAFAFGGDAGIEHQAALVGCDGGSQGQQKLDWYLTGGFQAKDHLASLKARVMAGRARERPRDVDPLTGEEQAACVRCGGAGRLIVPDLRAVQAGEWRPRPTAVSVAWDTCAVRCTCERGRLRHYGTVTLAGVAHDLMTLDGYEHANPGWQRQLETRRREERALAELDTPAAGRLAEVMQALAARLRMPGEDDPEPAGRPDWEGGAGW
jgi:hypothetical protein